jgi:hypothetical protein
MKKDIIDCPQPGDIVLFNGVFTKFPIQMTVEWIDSLCVYCTWYENGHLNRGCFPMEDVKVLKRQNPIIKK